MTLIIKAINHIKTSKILSSKKFYLLMNNNAVENNTKYFVNFLKTSLISIYSPQICLKRAQTYLNCV